MAVDGDAVAESGRILVGQGTSEDRIDRWKRNEDAALLVETTRRESERGDYQDRSSAKRGMDSRQGSPEPTPVTPAARTSVPTRDTEGPITMQTPDNVIGETLVVQGRVEFQNLLRIDGHFEDGQTVQRVIVQASNSRVTSYALGFFNEGELVGTGSLIIGPTAEVISNLRGLHEVYVEGILIGDCQCNKMQIRFSGCVTGNLQCGSLGMDPSVVLKGSANVNPREKSEKTKAKVSSGAPRPKQQRSQPRGNISDEASSSSKASGSTSVISPESVPAGVGAFDDLKASKQRSKGRGGVEASENEKTRGQSLVSSSSSSSDFTVSPSSTANGDDPPKTVPSKESVSSAPVVMPKMGDTNNVTQGRPPRFAGNKQGGSAAS